jgi:hypothetical protein
VEKIERYKTAQLAREIEVALPVELTHEQNIFLVRQYVQENLVKAGMCADICIHDKNDGNPHAHIMLTMRPIEQNGKWGQKSHTIAGKKVPTVDWNERSKAETWRKAWADAVNAVLEEQNHNTRVDHRSFARQGKEEIPTVHMGVAATQMEKRGIATERGNLNREIGISNQQIRQLRARIRKVKGWLYAQPLTNAPTMVSIMSHIADGKNLYTNWQKVANLKTQANVLMFLQQHNISDMKQLVNVVEQINQRFYEVSNQIHPVQRRLDTLAQHLAQYDNYKRHKEIYKKYKQTEKKKREAFYDKYSEEIEQYIAANQYLQAVMNGRTKIPVNTWKAEQKKLIVGKYSLCEEYYRLKDDTRNVELLRRGVENILRDDIARTQPTRAHGIDL